LSTAEALSALQHSGLARAISKANHLVIAGLQIVHVFGFLLLLSALVLMSLRLLGLALGRQSLSQVLRDPSRLFWLGLALAVVSGSLIFLTGPQHYFYNGAFELKMLLLLAAVLLQLTLFHAVARGSESHPLFTRLSVLLSLLLWFGVGAAGRAIGFT
jgi:hypothetical protein